MKWGVFPLLAVCTLLLISCINNQEKINTLAEAAYTRSQIKNPIPPNPFHSDGCSCWYDGDWVECCVEHDLIYWTGGTRDERETADAELMKCVTAKGHPTIARLMYVGVRAGGVWWLPTPFRWGFGWNYPQSGPPNKPY